MVASQKIMDYLPSRLRIQRAVVRRASARIYVSSPLSLCGAKDLKRSSLSPAGEAR